MIDGDPACQLANQTHPNKIQPAVYRVMDQLIMLDGIHDKQKYRTCQHIIKHKSDCPHFLQDAACDADINGIKQTGQKRQWYSDIKLQRGQILIAHQYDHS